MKKTLYFFFTILLSINVTSAFADEAIVENSGMDIVVKTDSSETRIDFSNAEFYDQNGNIVQSPDISELYAQVINTEKGKQIRITNPNTMYRDTSGGSWISGSGYRAVRGLYVSHYNSASVSFNADLELINRAPDRLNRVYNVKVSTTAVGIQGYVRQGVFNSIEGNYPAYGGVQYILNYGNGSNVKAVYLKVANDSFYIDINE